MSCCSIASDDQDTGSFFDLTDGVGHSTAAETGGQTGHRGGMSETGTVVYIVGLHYCAGKFLSEIIFLVSTLG